jgi:hypothetical protein
MFRYEFLQMPGTSHREVARGTFGDVIRKSKKKNVPRLLPLIEKASLLNDMRNEIAAHPMFIDPPVKDDAETGQKNDLLHEDINCIVSLVRRIDSKLADEIMSTRLISEEDKKTYVFGDVVSGISEPPYFMIGFWALIEQRVLKFLAGQAWHILKTISEELYGERLGDGDRH